MQRHLLARIEFNHQATFQFRPWQNVRHGSPIQGAFNHTKNPAPYNRTLTPV
jgi:hypothetical protein